MRKIVKACLSTVVFFTVFIFTTQAAYAQWTAINPKCVDVGLGNIATIQGIECLMILILRVIVRFAGIAAFVMIIVGGFQYLTSGGNPDNTKKAQSTITWGIAGIAVLLGSWLILKFIQILTNVDVTQFVIPGP